MGFYDSAENVNRYIEIAKGFDGRELIEILKKYVTEGSSVLELGMGPGVDLEILNKSYEVTGSDNSTIFLDKFHKRRPDITLKKIDIKNFQCDSRFDCIYSNKVLHHLTDSELKASLLQQKKSLHNHGVLFHTFWQGDEVEEKEEMIFNYHTVDSLRHIIEDTFKIITIEPYEEFGVSDSLYAVLSVTDDG